MAEATRREWLMYLAAAGVGTAYVVNEARDGGGSVLPGGGGGLGGGSVRKVIDASDGGGGGGGSGGASGVALELAVASTLGGLPDPDAPQVGFVTGDAERGCYLDLLGESKPYEVAGDGYEVAIADALGDVAARDTAAKFIFIDAGSADTGVYVDVEQTATLVRRAEDELATDDALGDLSTPDTRPQYGFITAGNPTSGLYVEA